MRLLPAIVALALIPLPPAASAQTNAPPGNSAIDEYLETVPGATGNQRPRQPGTGGNGGAALSPAERKRLQALGPAGKVLADAVEATGPPAAKRRQKIDTDRAEGRSPIGAVVGAVTGQDDGGGMGFMLPVILLASLLGVIVLVMLRHRSAS